MPIFLMVPPAITLLALILAWRTRGIERGLSIAIAVLSLAYFAWYFSELLAALEMA